MRTFPFHLGAFLLFVVTACGIVTAEEEKKEPAKEAPVKIRYRPPEIMLVTSVDWPAEEKHRETMAKFLVEKGINCVEAATDVLDVCRRNGLYVRVGARNGELGNLLQEIKDLRLKDDPAVFGYFISDRRRSSAFQTWACSVSLEPSACRLSGSGSTLATPISIRSTAATRTTGCRPSASSSSIPAPTASSTRENPIPRPGSSTARTITAMTSAASEASRATTSC